ncbi:hypothetical protein CPB84DRAFT_1732383, partial [Gymnopilus junonius]
MDLPVHNLDNTIGAALVGVLISSTLFGIVVVQTYTYYNRFPNDRISFKYLVSVIWVCELVHCGLISESIYSLIIKNYTNLSGLADIPLALSIAVAFTGIIEPLVQMFFAYRIFVVSRSIVIPAMCCVFSTVRCGLTFATAVASITSASGPQLFKNFKWLVGSALGVGSLVDVTLSTTMLYYLKRQKPAGDQGGPFVPLLINKIIVWTVQSGVMATLTGIVMLVFFFASSASYVWLAMFLFTSRIFSISLLASLNGRLFLHEDTLDVHMRHLTKPITFPSTLSVHSELTSCR